jgi:hypothetical protein
MKSPRKSMNAAGDGRLKRTLERCANPGMESASEAGLYGKLAFMHEEVRKVSFLAFAEFGDGAVVKDPVRLLDREYV